MEPKFLLYGAYGYVGAAIARMAAAQGLEPVLGGRDAHKTTALAKELGVESRVASLDSENELERALDGITAVLHCAGPFIHTYQPVLATCLQKGVHYLDLTGEIKVFQAIAACDTEASEKKIMLLPGAGFDVVPTDCLAVHLKQRLPGATRITLAFHSEGPGGMPPGTQRTSIEVIRYGILVRRNGKLETVSHARARRMIDFGNGPVEAVRMMWGDLFTAYRSTGIPNIEEYLALSRNTHRLLAWFYPLRGLFNLSLIRKLARAFVRPGPSDDRLIQTVTHVWGEVADEQGQTAVARLHGPEAGVIWTAQAALACIRRVCAGDAPPGYQTPATAYGPDFVFETGRISREDL